MKMKDSSDSDLDKLNLNLLLFTSKLIIINIDFKEFVLVLKDISEHLISNSFNIFTREKTPIK